MLAGESDSALVKLCEEKPEMSICSLAAHMSEAFEEVDALLAGKGA